MSRSSEPEKLCNRHEPDGRSEESALQQVVRRYNEKYDARRKEEYTQQKSDFERKLLKCIQRVIWNKEKESKKLQDFYRNGLFRRAIMPSEEYRVEYNHYFGLQAYGIPQSMIVGTATFGILNGMQVGDLATQLIVPQLLPFSLVEITCLTQSERENSLP